LPAAMSEPRSLPTGTVTLLFTDIEGSTRLWELDVEGTRSAIARHDAVVTGIIASHNGVVVRSRGEGDSWFGVFTRASDAVTAAATIQRAITEERWSSPSPLRVRIAVHTGETELRDGDYYGPEVNRCARIRALAEGGQTLVSEVTANLVRRSLPAGLALHQLGVHRLKDIQHPERVFELLQTAGVRRRRTLAATVSRGLSPVLKGALAAGGLIVGLVFILMTVTGSTRNPGAPPEAGPPRPYAVLSAQESASVHPSGLRLRLEASKSAYTAGEVISLKVHIENNKADAIEVSFQSEQLFEFIVRGLEGPDAGRPPYIWPRDRAYGGTPRTLRWNPGEDRVLEVPWPLPRVDEAKGPVKARYRLTAVLGATADPIEASLDLVIGER